MLTKDSSKYVDVLNQLAVFFRFQNSDSSFYYAKKALDISTNNNYQKGSADALNNIGCFYNSISIHLARSYLEDAIQIYQTIGDEEGRCEATMNLADFLPNTKNTTRKYLQDLYESSKSLKNDSIRASIISSMLYTDLKTSRKFDQRLFHEGLSIARKHNSKFLITVYTMIDGFQLYKVNKKRGMDILQNFRNRSEHSGSEFMVVFSYSLLGPLMLHEGRDSLGIFYLNKLIQKTEKIHPLVYIGALKTLYFYYESHHQHHKANECIILVLKKEIELEDFIAESSYNYNNFVIRQRVHQLHMSEQSLRAKTVILLSCLFFISLILLFFLYRSLQIKKQYAKVQKQLNDLTKIQNQDLQENNSFNNMLISIIAHDIRQPFSSIVMLSSVFNGKVNVLTEQTKLEIMNELGEISQRSIYFMDGLLEWIKSKRNGFEYQQEKLNLTEIVMEANTFFTSTQKRKRIKFLLDIPDQTVVLAHKQMLLFVIRNMINNATKFSPEQSNISVFSLLEGNRTVIAVADCGPGMSEQQLNTLFSSKYIKDEISSNDGARIAMRVSQELTSIMGAEISAISVPNVRTTFYLSLKNKSPDIII